jgi:RND family efflux transporter MFP subunit
MAAEDLSKLKIDKSTVFSAPAKSRKKLVYIIAAVALVIIISFLFLSGLLSPSVKVQLASVSEIYPSQTFSLLNASGYVVAQHKSALASKITGRIIELNVAEGSKVKKGEIIARLESNDVIAVRDQASANLSVARYNLDKANADLQDARLALNRNSELIKKGYIARAEYDTSEAHYKSARAAVDAATSTIRASSAALKGAAVSIDYTILRAPFDAVVLTKNADIGDIVTPIGATVNVQSAVVTIADMKSLLVEVDVSESNIGKIRMGQPCDIQLDALPDRRFRGKTDIIVPTADRSKATVMVKVRFVDKDPRVLPEMSAKVAFLSREPGEDEMKSFTAVSKSAIIMTNNTARLFTVKGDIANAVTVKTGRQFGDMIEILDGVKAGDKVVLKPADNLHDGSRIKTDEK